MLNVIFAKDGDLVSDFEAENFAKEKIAEYKNNKEKDMTIKVGTELMLICFLLPVIKHEFPKSEISFYKGNDRYQYDDYIGFDGMQSGEQEYSYYVDVTEQILNAGMKNIRNDRRKVIPND